jgi:hypothetical protein
MTDLRTAALRALEALSCLEYGMCGITDGPSDDTTESAITALREALAHPEDKSQAAFEHWVETVEATQGCAISRNAVVDATVTAAQMAHADATCKQSLQVEPCNKSCAPGYCYCEPMALQELLHQVICGDFNADNTDDLKLALAARKEFAALQPRRAWRGLTDSERAAVQYQSFKRGLSPLEFMELHEAKLKELNHD